jgi:hypothetical protein
MVGERYFMKTLLLFLFSIIQFAAWGQNFIGKYVTPYGYQLEVKADSSFLLGYGYCTTQFWGQGLWSTNGDTLVFEIKPIYDTLECNSHDSIILSEDNHPNTISCDSFYNRIRLDRYQMDEKDGFKAITIDNKLFYINDDGKVVKKIKGHPRLFVIGRPKLDGSGVITFRYRRKFSGEFRSNEN